MAEDETEKEEEQPAEEEAVPLKPRGKIAAIAVANILVLSMWSLVYLFGYRSPPDGWSAAEQPPALLYLLTASLAILLCFLPFILQGFFSGLVALWYSLVAARTPHVSTSDGTLEKILEQNDWLPSQVYRWAVTIAIYAHATVLVFTTGGARESAFAGVPIAVFILAPIIMTAIQTQVTNMVLGVAYIYAIYELDGGSLVVSLPQETIGTQTVVLSAKSWVEPAILVVVLVASLGLTLLRDWGSVRGRPRAPRQPPVGSGA